MTAAQLIKSFTLYEFVKAHWITLRYFAQWKSVMRGLNLKPGVCR